MSLLKVKNLKKYYSVKKSLFSQKKYVHAVDDVSFCISRGETVGLVGESGCGKTTLAKLIIKLERPTSGQACLDNKDINALSRKDLRKSRKKIQMIFQDPYGSLNPRINVLRLLDEVLYLHSDLSREERYTRIQELMLMVGLKEEHLFCFPHQFSGGQRQRIGIARALAVKPSLIIADEPVSALDVSVQAQIINLLEEIQKKTKVSFLFIAHDLAVVEHISDKILVMYLGKIVEYGSADQVCKASKHPYTQALLSAVPSVDYTKQEKKQGILLGDVPSPLRPPNGCRFHPRCPFVHEKCKKIEPALTEIKDVGHLSACFLN
jgi:oligopeptide/dipeptide ABC transporter ATP-binding protein